jgi:heterotetrameric sarcosine oxidase gamma subunit
MGYDVAITRGPLRTLFDLKGLKEAVVAWCGTALPDLPDQPNSLTAKGTRLLMWIGPDHWLLADDIALEEMLSDTLRPDTAPAEMSIVLVSDTLTFFVVEGSDSNELMAVATSLDLHPASFADDCVSQIEAFGIKALIRRVASGYEIAVDRSYEDWFEASLRRAAS